MITSLGAHIKVSNFSKSKAFYEVLGFKKVFEYGPDKPIKEKYRGTTYQVGTTKLEIAEGHPAVKANVFKQPITSPKVSLMINIENMTEFLDTCKKSGIPLAVGPRHYYWGKLEVVVKDPDGLILVFTVPYSEEEAKKIHADETFGKPPKI